MTKSPSTTDFSNYQLEDWLDHIQRQHWRTIDLKLDRIAEVWQRLEGKKPPLVITVAGTNGKGSCVAMLETVLRRGGLKTGSYTSPHLVRYNERVAINGVPVADPLLNQAFLDIEQARGEITLTYFEFGTLCALWIFQQQQVDACILETGMGGRLDAVNLIENDIALITSVGLDHEQWLGPDRESIGREKAGIIKPGGLVVCADPDPPASIEEVASARGATLIQAGRDYEITRRGRGDTKVSKGLYHFQSRHEAIARPWQDLTDLPLPFQGLHQMQNLGCVVASLGALADSNNLDVRNLQALDQARIRGRFEIIGESPLVIIDVAHNADSARYLGESLRTRPVTGKRYGVFGVLEDKDLRPIINEVEGEMDYWFLTTLEGDRGQSAESLEKKLLNVLPGAKTRCFPNPPAAYRAAIEVAAESDRVVAFGSFYTVGDILGAI